MGNHELDEEAIFHIASKMEDETDRFNYLVHVCGAPTTEDGDEDREANRDLGGRNHHDEEGGNLAFDQTQFSACCDEREIHRVQHQLD